VSREIRPVTFPSDDLQPVSLEGVLHLCGGEAPWPAAVICHPHPLGGGDMHNRVVTAIAQALCTRGVAALRFNFRGVGFSCGDHDNGRGEQADVAGALQWLLAQPHVDVSRLFVVGYSFGAWVGLSHAEADLRVAAVAAVALVPWSFHTDFYQLTSRAGPLAHPWRFDPAFLETFTRPKLLLAGEQDTYSTVAQLRELYDRIPEPKALGVISSADHFLHGREQEVGARIAEFLAAL
jgi:alpha/beta superfamily hydrolase